MLEKDKICFLHILLGTNRLCEQLSEERMIKVEEFQKLGMIKFEEFQKLCESFWNIPTFPGFGRLIPKNHSIEKKEFTDF